MTCCDTKLIQRNTSMLMMTSFSLHAIHKRINGTKSRMKYQSYQWVFKKSVTKSSCRKVNFYIWTKKKLRGIVVEEHVKAATWKVGDGGKLNVEGRTEVINPPTRSLYAFHQAK